MNTPSRLRQLIQGLALSAIVIATIAGAVLLSGPKTVAQTSSLPSPIASAAPAATATPTSTRSAIELTPTAIQHATSIYTSTYTSTSTATPSPTATACPIPIGWQPMTFGPFDTLFSLAAKFNVTPDALAQANCLSGYAISAGQTIYVPSTTPTATTAPCYPPYWWTIYIVRRGDTLSSLAVRYNISIAQLQIANCLTTTLIYAGQPLRVPPIAVYPTSTPTFIPSATPTDMPTATFTLTPEPTIEPTSEPTLESTITPTIAPTDTPTSEPPTPTDTYLPTPTDTPVPPTDIPTLAPTSEPTFMPTIDATAVMTP